MNQTITFETDHLLGKWGFADGDYLEETLLVNGYQQSDPESDEWFEFVRRTLCEVVEIYVLPRIRNTIKPQRIVSSHNPIRVYEVDGQRVEDLPKDFLPEPHSVEVEQQLILEVASRVFEQRYNSDGTLTSYMVRSPEANQVFLANSWY